MFNQKKSKKSKKSKLPPVTQTLLVLEDDAAFSGTDGAILQWHDISDADWDNIENGCLPYTRADVIVKIETLLAEAKAANLPCVKNLK